jgi:sec-independent protein translocase protein TatC
MPLDQIEDEVEAQEMTFLDHLEELRWHLIRSLVAIMVFAVVAFVGKGFFFGKLILGPSKVEFYTYEWLCQLSNFIGSDAFCIDELPFILQSRQMTGQFTMHIISSFVIGIIIAFPYAFWEIWRFIRPGLYERERKAARGATFYVSFLFTVGVLFGYFVVVPISVNFLANYQIDPSIMNEFDIVSYVTTVTTLVLACGLLFQLPIVVYFGAKAGVITSTMMKTYRRHAIVAILVLGAMLTPPDPFSQILIALPLIGLYQIGIFIARRVEKRELQTMPVKSDGNLPDKK